MKIKKETTTGKSYPTLTENDHILKYFYKLLIHKMATKPSQYKTRIARIGDFIKACDFYRILPQELSEPSVSGASSKQILRVR